LWKFIISPKNVLQGHLCWNKI